MAERIFDIKGFTWWEADDLVQWPANSFFQAENVEIRKNLSWAKLASQLKDTWWTFDGNITCIENLRTLWVAWNWEDIVVCTDAWKIYLNWTLKHTISTSWDKYIVWLWVWTSSGTQYIYYVSKVNTTSKIHRSDTSITTATFQQAYRTFTVANTTYDKAFCITADNNIYIAVNNKVLKLNLTWEVLTDWLVLPESRKITWFSKFENNFQIYSKESNTWIHNRWDWTAILPSYEQHRINQPILWTVNDWATDYAILWFNENYSDLYRIDWVQKTELRVNLEQSATSRVLHWDLSIREWLVYISWWLTWQSSNYWVYTYGNYYPWASKGLVQEFSWWATNKFLWHCHWISNSYFACLDNKVYAVTHLNPANDAWLWIYYASSGYIVSPMYQGNLWEEKTFTKTKVAFKLETNSSIKIYARTDFSASFVQIKEIDYATYWSKKHCTIFKNEITSALGNFNEFQLKIELIAWSTWALTNNKTPEICRVTTFLDSVKEQ